MHKPSIGELKQLIGNPDAYAVHNEDGSYTPVRKRLSNLVLREHRAGTITVGTYIVSPPNQARTLVFDIDTGNLADAHAIKLVLDDLGLASAVEFSGKKGYHVWVLADGYMDAAQLQRLGRGVREEAGLPSIEVFPKQDEVRDLGSLVKLPGGTHRVTLKSNDFLESFPEANSVEALTLAAEKYPEQQLRKAHDGDNTHGVSFPCVHKIQEGVAEGSRNVKLFQLAVMLRRASLTEENVELVVRAVNEKSDPPLEDVEIDNIIAGSAYSGPICSQLDGETHCGGACVIENKPGLHTRPGGLKWAADGEPVVVFVTERGDEGRVVELEHPDAGQIRAVLNDKKPSRKAE